MKARFIYESLDFERGLDPKKSMSIGRHWSKTKREIANEIIRRCESELEDVINNVHAKAKMKGYKNSFDYIEQAYGMELKNIKKDPVIENAIEEVTVGINKILEEYPVFEPDKNDSLMNDITNFFTAGEPPFGTLMTIIEATLDPQLKESVNFERGLDPIKALDLGIVNKIPWQSDYRIKDDKVQLKTFIRDYNGFSILSWIYPNQKIYQATTTIFASGGKATEKEAIDEVKKYIDKSNRDNPERIGIPRVPVLESVNFKRGRAPIKTLGIGQEAIKNKLIGILPDLSKTLFWSETAQKIISGIKREDTTISISKNYIIVKSPVLTWRFADNLRLILNMSPIKVELEKKPSRERIYLRKPEGFYHEYKIPRVYKYRIL